MGKLFVIMEVRHKNTHMEKDIVTGNRCYEPVDGRGYMWLPDDAVIPAERLRFDFPRKDQEFLDFNDTPIFQKAAFDFKHDKQWCLDSPASPDDPWDAWVEEMPDTPSKFKAWFKRMPRKSQ